MGFHSIFQQLAEELNDFLLRECQDLSPQGSRPVHATGPLSKRFYFRAQVAFALECVKHRIESTGAELVTVPAQFLDKPEAENWRLASMMQDMETNQASIEVLVSFMAPLFLHGIRLSLSNFDSYILKAAVKKHSPNYNARRAEAANRRVKNSADQTAHTERCQIQ
jgi:hypothetical protein